jgi:Tol biopolymer transport system component
LKSQLWRGVRWSPDGRSFIAATGAAVGQKPGIYQFDAVSGQAMPVVEAGGCSQLVWSPDGKGIFYLKSEGILDLLVGKSRIVYRDPQSQTEKEVLTPGNPAFTPRLDFWFNPSPDGRQIALLGEPNADSMALWLVPLVGGASRELLKVTTPGTFAGGVGWTPDGRFILFIQLGGDETQRGLWYISANGGEPRKVALTGVEAKNVTRLAIHPDGKQLALDVRGTGISEVWALENFLPPLKDSAPPAAADASAARGK